MEGREEDRHVWGGGVEGRDIGGRLRMRKGGVCAPHRPSHGMQIREEEVSVWMTRPPQVSSKARGEEKDPLNKVYSNVY